MVSSVAGSTRSLAAKRGSDQSVTSHPPGRYLALTPGGDAVVAKWVADLKNRKPATLAVSRKEPG